MISGYQNSTIVTTQSSADNAISIYGGGTVMAGPGNDSIQVFGYEGSTFVQTGKGSDYVRIRGNASSLVTVVSDQYVYGEQYDAVQQLTFYSFGGGTLARNSTLNTDVNFFAWNTNVFYTQLAGFGDGGKG